MRFYLIVVVLHDVNVVLKIVNFFTSHSFKVHDSVHTQLFNHSFAVTSKLDDLLCPL